MTSQTDLADRVRAARDARVIEVSPSEVIGGLVVWEEFSTCWVCPVRAEQTADGVVMTIDTNRARPLDYIAGQGVSLGSEVS